MTTNEEAGKSMGFGSCCSMMSKCCEPGSEEKKGGKFNFENCQQMMKQFCTGKDGKVDFGEFCSKIEKFCKAENKESNDKANK